MRFTDIFVNKISQVLLGALKGQRSCLVDNWRIIVEPFMLRKHVEIAWRCYYGENFAEFYQRVYLSVTIYFYYLVFQCLHQFFQTAKRNWNLRLNFSVQL